MFTVSSTTSEESYVRKQQSVEVWQAIPLILAVALLTSGLAMVLSGTEELMDVVKPVIVVFGGVVAGLLLTFSTQQLAQSLQLAVLRGVRGGTAPEQMLRAMLKICEVSRRDGLQGVADVRSNSDQVDEVCFLIGQAAEESTIRFALERRMARENLQHRMTVDVFLFSSVFAVAIGTLHSLLLYVTRPDADVLGNTFMPFVFGVSLAIVMSVLLGRLRASHLRELVMVEIAYRGAAMLLEDNNVQRLRGRLIMLVPPGLRR